MVLTEPLTRLIFGSLEKHFFQKKRWQMTNCKKIVVYIALKDIGSYGVSDWLEKESTELVLRSLAPRARKLQLIDEPF